MVQQGANSGMTSAPLKARMMAASATPEAFNLDSLLHLTPDQIELYFPPPRVYEEFK